MIQCIAKYIYIYFRDFSNKYDLMHFEREGELISFLLPPTLLKSGPPAPFPAQCWKASVWKMLEDVQGPPALKVVTPHKSEGKRNDREGKEKLAHR